MKFAITGGDGAVGHHVVALARRAGHETVVISRRMGVDLMRADGLTERIAGADAVIDLASPTTLSTRKIVAFFTSSARNLATAEQRAGVGHHVALSIIGATEYPSGYYAGKAAQEEIVTTSRTPWSMLRTTQFHEFAQQTVNRGTIAGFHISPKMRAQPLAAADVAVELLLIAEGAPRGLEPDLAGPREEYMPDMVHRYARAVGKRNPLLSVSMPGVAGRAMRDGSLLAAPATRTTTQTFAEWLSSLQEWKGL
ncbi:SDR family oxidoreductase [Microbacterium yannicii]|uniref:SDR family oxidoreductase n=1 Tax=Microbacterium yannicii TaxID=671622 RepID=UPI0004746B13|nr:SDR family oxidoreductase [Microbacterium yannicii]